MYPAVLSFPVDEFIQKLIDASVHEIISARYAHQAYGAFGKCAMYAIVGAQTLSMLTGAHCEAVCGGQILDCGGGQAIIINPEMQEISKAKNLSDIRMYHCWIQVYLPDEPYFDPLVVDFSTRYDPQSALLFGQKFAPELFRDFVWCRLGEFHQPIPDSVAYLYPLTKKIKTWLWRDARCEVLLKKFAQENAAQFTAIASAVLLNFADRIESQLRLSPTVTA